MFSTIEICVGLVSIWILRRQLRKKPKFAVIYYRADRQEGRYLAAVGHWVGG